MQRYAAESFSRYGLASASPTQTTPPQPPAAPHPPSPAGTTDTAAHGYRIHSPHTPRDKPRAEAGSAARSRRFRLHCPALNGIHLRDDALVRPNMRGPCLLRDALHQLRLLERFDHTQGHDQESNQFIVLGRQS